MDSAVAALIGAGIGGLTGIASQFIGAELVNRREHQARARREKRTQAAVAAMLDRLRLLLAKQVRTGLLWQAHWFEKTLAPIQRVMSEPSLLLDLETEQTDAVLLLMEAMDNALELMAGFVAISEGRQAKTTTKDEFNREFNDLQKTLQKTFEVPYRDCQTAQALLGKSLPPTPYRSPNEPKSAPTRSDHGRLRSAEKSDEQGAIPT